MKATLLRASGTTVVMACSLLMPAGIANAEASISTTGPDSTNIITDTNKTSCTVTNNNNVDLTNNNSQSASSGNVSAEGNTTVGSVTSGNASNTSNTSVDVNLTNSGCFPTEVVTPTPTPTPSPTPSPTPTPVVMAPQVSAPVGGMGGGEESTPVLVTPTSVSSEQVVAPVGGVGAGSGGTSVFATIASATVASALWFGARARKQFAGLFS